MPDFDIDPKISAPRSSSGMAGLAAVAVGAATALWVSYRARKAEREHPPIGQFVVVDKVRLHYVERGEGPPVVLLHGNGVQTEDFIASGLIDALAQRHRVIAFDRPGFGHSQRPRLRLWTPQAQAALLHRALTQLDVGPCVVVGHSWGTLVALAMGLDYPADINGLVLVSGYYYPTARPDVPLNAPAAVPVLGDALRYTVLPLTGRLLLKRSLRAMFAPVPLPAHYLNVVPAEMLVRPLQIRAATEDGTLMIPAVAKLRYRYDEMKKPVTLIAGDGDKIVNVRAHTRRLHKEVAHSKLVVVPGAGHMVHHGDTLAIVAAVAEMSGIDLGFPLTSI